MSSDASDLWLERSRLNGMLLGAVSYGVFFLLTIQATAALIRQPRSGAKIAGGRLGLLAYTLITFVLGTVGFAGNTKFTEMIWIDLRGAPDDPAALIQDELDYPINVMAIVCYYVMELLMQALLLHRCFVIWNWARFVVIPMATLYIAMTAMSILVLIQASTGLTWYNINTVLIYLSIHVGINLIYTILVTNRLLFMRSYMKKTMGEYDSSIYSTVVRMTVESAILYSALAIIFLISFALHSYVSNLCFLAVSHVQGISQLLIIIRVARGRAIESDWPTQDKAAPSTSMAFSGTALDATEEIDVERIGLPEQDGVELCPVHSAKAM